MSDGTTRRQSIATRAARCALAIYVATTSAAYARTIDFRSQAGLDATCTAMRRLKPAAIVRDDERVAYAICAAIDLAKDAASAQRDGSMPFGQAKARTRLESYVARVAVIRSVLERVHARAPLFVVEPGKWAIDFDGDGAVSLHERYFFWTPKRDVDTSFFDRAKSENDYRARYAAPVVNVDPSDVLWALAYCNFVEAALNLVLSYDVAEDGRGVVLVNRARVRQVAYTRLMEGLHQSAKLREALLAETDDDREWIPNPRQRDTSFPLVMDEQTFATWGETLTELIRMLEGKALFGGSLDSGGILGQRDLTFGLCPPGTGLDLHDVFVNPLQHPLDTQELGRRCVAPTRDKPMSRLATVISASIRRNANAGSGAVPGEWRLLRHLYWVN